MTTRKDELEKYLITHDIEKQTNQILNEMLLEMPPNPYHYLAKAWKERSQISNGILRIECVQSATLVNDEVEDVLTITMFFEQGFSKVKVSLKTPTTIDLQGFKIWINNSVNVTLSGVSPKQQSEIDTKLVEWSRKEEIDPFLTYSLSWLSFKAGCAIMDVSIYERVRREVGSVPKVPTIALNIWHSEDIESCVSDVYVIDTTGGDTCLLIKEISVILLSLKSEMKSKLPQPGETSNVSSGKVSEETIKFVKPTGRLEQDEQAATKSSITSSSGTKNNLALEGAGIVFARLGVLLNESSVLKDAKICVRFRCQGCNEKAENEKNQVASILEADQKKDLNISDQVENEIISSSDCIRRFSKMLEETGVSPERIGALIDLVKYDDVEGFDLIEEIYGESVYFISSLSVPFEPEQGNQLSNGAGILLDPNSFSCISSLLKFAREADKKGCLICYGMRSEVGSKLKFENSSVLDLVAGLGSGLVLLDTDRFCMNILNRLCWLRNKIRI